MIFFQVLLLCLLCIHTPASTKPGTQSDWKPITENDWQPKDDIIDGYDAVLLFEEIVADDRRLAENKCTFTLYRRIKIGSNKARKWANVTAPLIHERQKIKGIKGRTTLQTGKQFYLSQSQILEKNIYETRNVEIDQLSFVMPGVSDNSIIEYSIKYELPQSNHRWLFQKEIPLIRGEYHWLTYQFQPKNNFDYKNYFNRFSSDNGQKETRPSDEKKINQLTEIPTATKLTPAHAWLQDGQDTHTEFKPSKKEPKEIVFSVKNIPAFEAEPLTLPEVSLKHQLRCFYLDRDSKIFWKSVAQNTMEFISDYGRLKNKLRKISSKFKTLQSENEKILACYNWLQKNLQTSNYGIAPDNARTGQTVDDILRRGYGTVAEINHVFYLMLKDMGIDAYMAYTSNRSQHLFYTDVKQLEFDIILVAVPRDIDYRFFSPGELFLPETQVPWYAEGTTAFLVNEDSYGFHNIPYSSPNLNKTKRITWLKIDKQFNCTGKIFEVYGGHAGREYQISSKKFAASFWEESLQEELANIVPELSTQITYTKSRNSQKAKSSFFSNVQFPLLQNRISPRLFIRPADFMIKVENPFHQQTRKQTIVFDYAYELVDVLHMELPRGWEIEALPKAFEFENDVGLCEANFFMTGNLFSVQRKFRLNRPVWQAGDYDKVCNLFKNQQMSTLLTAIIKVDENTTLSLRD